MTATVRTTRRIDLGQLTAELGGAELSSITKTGTTTISGDLDQAALEAAVATHVAADRTGNESTLRQRAGDALATNRQFLALAAPTNAQVVAQVKALTRQNNVVIRLLLQAFDGTD